MFRAWVMEQAAKMCFAIAYNGITRVLAAVETWKIGRKSGLSRQKVMGKF